MKATEIRAFADKELGNIRSTQSSATAYEGLKAKMLVEIAIQLANMNTLMHFHHLPDSSVDDTLTAQDRINQR
jgi:hypothetical protein